MFLIQHSLSHWTHACKISRSECWTITGHTAHTLCCPPSPSGNAQVQDVFQELYLPYDKCTPCFGRKKIQAHGHDITLLLETKKGLLNITVQAQPLSVIERYCSKCQLLEKYLCLSIVHWHHTDSLGNIPCFAWAEYHRWLRWYLPTLTSVSLSYS